MGLIKSVIYVCGAIILMVALIVAKGGPTPEQVKAKAQAEAQKVQSSQPSVQRTFVEADFDWYKSNSPYKKTIIAGVNKIHRENDKCKTIDPKSADVSVNRSTPSTVTFFVTCGEDGSLFSAYFTKADVDKDTTLSAVENIDRSRAIDLCEAYVKRNANHPSTVNFNTIMGLTVEPFINGNTRINYSFTAKNGFGLETKHNAYCFFEGSRMTESNISEDR